MFAVIKTGGKQYKVQDGYKILIEKLPQNDGENVSFDQVLLYVNSEDVKIGQPFIGDAIVVGKILEHGKGDKKIVFRYKSKTRYKKKKGHRQPYTKVEILKIFA